MPHINDYKCNKCDFKMPRGFGYYLYVEDNNGKRIMCPHPSEKSYVEDVLGERPAITVIKDRTGFNSFCICLDCLHQFVADLGSNKKYWSPYEYVGRSISEFIPRNPKDTRQCPKCKSVRVKTELEMIEETCPKCKDGKIEEIWTGLIS